MMKRKVKTAKKKIDVGPIFTTLLSKRANIGFTTGGHTGEDVFLYSYGPQKPYGLIQIRTLRRRWRKRWALT